jgi:hypothetical protein
VQGWEVVSMLGVCERAPSQRQITVVRGSNYYVFPMKFLVGQLYRIKPENSPSVVHSVKYSHHLRYTIANNFIHESITMGIVPADAV